MISYLVGQLIVGEGSIYHIKKARVRSYPQPTIPEKVVSDYRMSLRLTNEFPIMIGTISPQSNIDATTAGRIFDGDIEIENLAKYRNIFSSNFTIIGADYKDAEQLESLFGQNMTFKGKSTKWMVGF